MNMAASSSVPLQPKSILRGHKSQVHAACFTLRNSRLLTGDVDGFIIAWDLTIMRPRAVWQAHSNAILGIAPWGDDKIITHGRDNRLVVWRLTTNDVASMSTALPLDSSPGERPQPWILHILEVNTMNFCPFSSCPSPSAPEELLIAVPNTLASEAIDIFHLPSQRRIHTVKLGEKNGMVMALSIFFRWEDLVLVAAYENGLAVVARLDGGGCEGEEGVSGSSSSSSSNDSSRWDVTYQSKAHTQPILSLDVTPTKDAFFTSSADAVLAKHPIPSAGGPPESVVRQGSRSRPTTTAPPQTQPLKIISTKHSGQQSLRVRSDGRVLVTAGWDAKIRVYSCKTMKEVAVLKWHQVGCYATAFASVASEHEPMGKGPGREVAGSQSGQRGGEEGDENEGEKEASKTISVTVPKLVEITARERRISQAENAHWIAAGSKDGKVSLWDVF